MLIPASHGAFGDSAVVVPLQMELMRLRGTIIGCPSGSVDDATVRSLISVIDAVPTDFVGQLPEQVRSVLADVQSAANVRDMSRAKIALDQFRSAVETNAGKITAWLRQLVGSEMPSQPAVAYGPYLGDEASAASAPPPVVFTPPSVPFYQTPGFKFAVAATAIIGVGALAVYLATRRDDSAPFASDEADGDLGLPTIEAF